MVKKDFDFDVDFDRLAEEFLVENKIEIKDEGFTMRVMRNLPSQADWQRRLSIVWNCICIVLLVIFCWQTNVLTNLWIDIKAYIATIPANIQDFNIWQTASMFYFVVLACTTIFIMGMTKQLTKNK